MYINERDQINYHGFLRALREMHKVSQETVSIGICTVSGMNRFENGNRIAEKLMRDRLTARLGISGEKYEDYLQRKEYIRWQHRLRIIRAIEKREVHVAKEELDAYVTLQGLNVLNKQFVETMRFMILSLEEASKDELLGCINKAVKFTIPNVKKALEGKHLLSDQEINLILEQMSLVSPKPIVRDEIAWRISEYEKLIVYIENSHWETLQKAKVYPKVVYYICQLLLQREMNEEEIRRGLELCYTAIELLRDSARLYYFVELTEIRRTLAESLLSYEIDVTEKIQLEEMLTENSSWEKVLKELYMEYDVALYMSNFGYLYHETECHDMAEVVEIRRNMFGLSRIKISEGVCTDRTILRFEREGRDPNVEVVRRLFDKMGLCAEYRRAKIVTNDVGALNIYYKELVKSVNDVNVDRGLEIVSLLEKRINMCIPYNKQELERTKTFLLYNGKRIQLEEFIIGIRRALGYTIQLILLNGNKKKYLTVEEIICVQDLAFAEKLNETNACRKIIDDICEKAMKSKEIRENISLLELLMARLASKLGDEGKYNESNAISDRIMKECLIHHRMADLSSSIYNKSWNMEQEKTCDTWLIRKNLYKCVVLSHIIKKYNAEAFFREKLEKKGVTVQQFH